MDDQATVPAVLAGLREELDLAAAQQGDGLPLARRLAEQSQPELLHALLRAEPIAPERIRQALRVRLRELIDGGGVGDLLSALYHAEPSQQREAVARLAATADDAALAVIAVEAEDGGTRLSAAQSITDTTLLGTVLKSAIQRDRRVARAVRARLEKRADEERRQQDQWQGREQSCAALEVLAQAPWHASYGHQLAHRLRKWQHQADGASAELHQRATRAQRRCEERVEDHRRAVELPLQMQRCCELLEEALVPLRVGPVRPGLSAVEPPLLDTVALRCVLREQEALWAGALAEEVAPDDALGQRWQQLLVQVDSFCAAVDSVVAKQPQLEQLLAEPELDESLLVASQRSERLEELQQQLAWPPAFAEPSVLVELHGAIKRQRKCCRHLEQAERVVEAKIETAVKRLHGLLRRGSLRQATALLRRTEAEQLSQLGERARQRSMQALEGAKKRLEELSGWRDFAAQPKYIALCDEMERLAREDMHPRAKAARIKALQQQWQSLGRVGDEDLWQRFRSLSERAFEPCAAFFERERAQREQNLQQRQKLCAQLAEWLGQIDPERPDWQETMALLQRVDSQWQRSGPVPKEQREAVEQRYRQLCAELDQHLEPARAALHRQRQQLIAQAQALVAPKDAQKAKLMQHHFKTLMAEDDPQQAQAFQAVMDTFFAGAEDARLRRQRERAEQQGKLRDLTAALRALEPTAAAERYQQLCQEADALLAEEHIAGDAAAKLRREYEQCAERRQRHTARQRMQTEREELGRRADLCLCLEGAEPAERTTLGEELASQWSSGIDLPPKLHQAMQHRWAAAMAGEPAVPPQERHLACIRAELLAAIDSPPEDSELRTTYQLQNMQHQGLKSGQISRGQVDALRREWLCGPVADPETEKALAGRFAAAVEALEQQLGAVAEHQRKALAAIAKRADVPARKKPRRRRPRA